MAVVSRTLVGGPDNKILVLLINIDSSDVTNQIVYDNSAFINDVTKGNLMHCTLMGSDCLATLKWDQTTDSVALSANPINSPIFDLREIGGIPNPKGTGATGDLLLTTTGIGAGEAITLILWIYQN